MKDFWYSGVFKNWATTLLGLLGALYLVLEPILTTGQMPTKQQFIGAIFSVVGGFLAKSFNVTGGIVKHDTPMIQKSDVTAKVLEENKGEEK